MFKNLIYTVYLITFNLILFFTYNRSMFLKIFHVIFCFNLKSIHSFGMTADLAIFGLVLLELMEHGI